MAPISPVPIFGVVFNASHGMVPLVYATGLIAMLFTALSYRAMSREYPAAGSVYTYASQSLGPLVGFLAGWAMVLDYLLIPTISYVASAIAVHAAAPAIPSSGCVLLMVGVATVINVLGIQSAARASFALLALQLLIIALFVGLSVPALMHHMGGAQLSLRPLYNPAEFSPSLLFEAMSFAVLSFMGFDAISTLSEEVKDGAASVGRATMLSLCLCAVLFMAQTWIAALFLPGRTTLAAGDPTQEAFYYVADLLGGYRLKFLMAVPGVVLSSLAGALAAQAATARLLYGMARDGKLPKVLAQVDARRGVPLPATLTVAALTLVLGLLLVHQLDFLSSMISFGALVGFLLLHVSAIGHFIWRQRSRLWVRHLAAPLVGLVIVADVLLSIPHNAKLIGAAWLSLGCVVFLSSKLCERGQAIRQARARERGGIPLCDSGADSK